MAQSYDLTTSAPDQRTFEHNKSNFHSICRSGNVFELMEMAPFIGSDERLLNENDHRGRLCTHIVARYNQMSAVMKIEILLNLGTDPNARESKTGDTLLHIAVIKKNYQLAEWLCQQPRVNTGAINFAHQTPFHLAYLFRDQKMMDIFRNNGAVCDELMDSDSSGGYDC